VFEGGPQFPRFPASLWGLVRALQLENEFIAGDKKAKRFILRGGRLHRAPLSARGLLSTGLVSGRSKIRLLGEVFRNSRPPEEEESLADFVQRKFGQEILDYLVDPFISTIFLGMPIRWEWRALSLHWWIGRGAEAV
jgi:oxygen-dependent protoporphyrinogen oxidase